MAEMMLQFGYGMMAHCRELIARWGRGTAILSPRDLSHEQLVRVARQIIELPNSQVLLDPQFYLPHSDHFRLSSHSYWPDRYDTASFWSGPGKVELLRRLYELNQILGCKEFILPGLYAQAVEDVWCETQEMIIEEAKGIVNDMPLICTVALAADVVRNRDQIGELVERLDKLEVDAFYLVCEHPQGDYFVREPLWVGNILDISANLKLQGRKVILGYCNQQMLIAALAKVDAIASGTWMNVRSFPPEKFSAAYEEEIRQRATWYYCPQAFSEYKLPFLDIAFGLGMLDRLAPSADYQNEFAGRLFEGAQPSVVGLSEQNAFRHYLTCLDIQARDLEHTSYDETVATYEELLNEAESLLRDLGAARVTGQNRDFTDIIDVNRAAMGYLDLTRGPLLRRTWNSI